MFVDGSRIQYLTHAGVIFLVYLFIMILVFYTFSPFVDGFFGVYSNMDIGDASDEVAYYGPLFHLAVKIALAAGVAIPMVWFIFWCFSREPSRSRRRYY